jgi:hypothetical protein
MTAGQLRPVERPGVHLCSTSTRERRSDGKFCEASQRLQSLPRQRRNPLVNRLGATVRARPGECDPMIYVETVCGPTVAHMRCFVAHRQQTVYQFTDVPSFFQMIRCPAATAADAPKRPLALPIRPSRSPVSRLVTHRGGTAKCVSLICFGFRLLAPFDGRIHCLADLHGTYDP